MHFAAQQLTALNWSYSENTVAFVEQACLISVKCMSEVGLSTVAFLKVV